jgi:RHS repeat-associated protein
MAVGINRTTTHSGGERVYGSLAGSPWKFTGKERDPESGLDNFGARYDSASMGRFMRSDPDNAGAIPDDPQSWNGYAYARNNPLLYTDPDGTNYRVCDNEGNNCADLSVTADYARKLAEWYQRVGASGRGTDTAPARAVLMQKIADALQRIGK